MERVKGIEPSSQAWEARILPLNHTRARTVSNFALKVSSGCLRPRGGGAPLIATSAPAVTASGQPAAMIMDFAPMQNILTFEMCSSIANPQVAAATAAALGGLNSASHASQIP
jgi:hypothetical protein